MIDAVSSLVGQAVEMVQDVVTQVIDIGVDLAKAALDAGKRMMDSALRACLDVADALWEGVQAVQKAWDNLDPGLKQWIITGVSMAVSFIPIAGPLISCVIDGTFEDMWNAIQRGDWGTLALGCAAMVPGTKGATKAFKAVSHLDDVSRAVKAAGKSGRVAIIGEDMKGRVLPFAKKLECKGLKVETFTPSRGLTKAQALEENAWWIRNLKKEGIAIVDRGPSPERAMYPEPTSDFYRVEKAEVKGYWNLWTIWGP